MNPNCLGIRDERRELSLTLLRRVPVWWGSASRALVPLQRLSSPSFEVESPAPRTWEGNGSKAKATLTSGLGLMQTLGPPPPFPFGSEGAASAEAGWTSRR